MKHQPWGVQATIVHVDTEGAAVDGGLEVRRTTIRGARSVALAWKRRRPLAALAAAAVLLAGCAGGVPTAPGVDDTTLDELEQNQQQLSEDALASLADRRCPRLPERASLQGLPDDVLPCLGTGPGRAVSAGDGRPTVINLWASWCPPCLEEMPMLQRAADAAGDDVRFVGIDTQDQRDSAAGMLEFMDISYPSYEDPDGLVLRAVRGLGLPVTLVYDSKGRQVSRAVGTVDAAWLQDALNKAGVPAEH